MNVGSYLENRQPIIYKTFSNAIKKGSVARSYLLLGEEGTPLLEVAKYMAKSLVCDHPSPLADEECITCKRIEEGNYPDLIILNGDEGSIKKDEVKKVINDFQQTPYEKKGVMIYIVHLVEKMGPEATNSLLKFLEEPTPNTYAILTTKNEARVLETIISRCQCMRMRLIPRYEIIEEAEGLGVPLEDAEMLSHFYNDASLIAENSSSKAYENAKMAANITLEALADSQKRTRFVMEKTVLPILSDKSALRLYFEMMSVLFKDVERIKVGDEAEFSTYANILGELSSKLPHIEETLKGIMATKSEIELNINASLLLSHLVSIIYRE